VLAKFREPLSSAAYELRGRLYNIIELGFLGRSHLQSGGVSFPRPLLTENVDIDLLTEILTARLCDDWVRETALLRR
jgi:hypothetical protein